MYNIKADRTPSEEKLFHYHSSILSFGELYYQLTWLGYSIPSKWFGNKSTTNKQPRIEVPIFYEDARGQQRTSGMHYVLLPHEILGTFYQFEAADLMMKLTGGPGVSWMQSFRGALGNSRYIYIYSYSLHDYIEALAEFWSHEQTTEWFRNHPILRVTWLHHLWCLKHTKTVERLNCELPPN